MVFCSLVNKNVLSGGKVQCQCSTASAESLVLVVAASLFVNTSLLQWDQVKVTAGEEYLNLVMFLYDVSRLESRNLLFGGALSMSLLDRKFVFVSTSLL